MYTPISMQIPPTFDWQFENLLIGDSVANFLPLQNAVGMKIKLVIRRYYKKMLNLASKWTVLVENIVFVKKRNTD